MKLFIVNALGEPEESQEEDEDQLSPCQTPKSVRSNE